MKVLLSIISLLLVILLGLIFWRWVITYGSWSAKVEQYGDVFYSNPTNSNLKILLNAKSDGDSAYLHGAIIGKCFAKHPRVFKSFSKDINSDSEYFWYSVLRDRGGEIFEYHEFLMPKNYSEIHSSQAWLKSFITKQ